ncbi:MAG TPA: DUF434 domain-containing protein [Pyrinomonadaceae bacterium]|nr:DUF434 domain-containing protein [Pyrinomonadaceae bacterium]
MSPDRRRHRGAHPEDARTFGEEWLAALRVATSELSWLLSRGYQPKSSLKLVGDRHALRERQRLAVARAACAEASLERRRASRVDEGRVAGEALIVDGFNLVITLEAALSGGVLVRGRDGCVRDLSSVHGSYRAVEETERAVLLAGEALAALRPESVLWLLDRPVSNSGRLAERVRAVAAARGWPWRVEVEFNPDREIVNSARVAVTSDSNVLDGVARWLNLGRMIVERHVPGAWVLNLGDEGGENFKFQI